MSPNAALARPGCGCGGGSHGGTGCGAGGAVSAGLSARAFARPTFFAGQLLTEDDLGALTAYVTAKDRLHNRYLFGAGVVCGLWVSCDPCGGGTVTVQPGYALDCYGNDLVLACPAPLDVNAMIRDLRAARLGKDCGDPCADQAPSAAGQKARTVRHYRLYARYIEQSTDPVAPYATVESSGQGVCEPTRIREGISFVLKCPGDLPPPDDLWSRLQACLPGDDIRGRGARLTAYSGPMIAAAAAVASPPAFSQQDADQLGNLQASLTQVAPGAVGDQIRSATEQVRQLAAVLARYELDQNHPDLASLPDVRSGLQTAAAALVTAQAADQYGALDRPAVTALLDQAAQLADPPATLPPLQLAMLAQGRPLDDSVLADLAADATALQGWLLTCLDSDPMLADCELRSLAQAVSVTSATSQDTVAFSSLGQAGSTLAGLYARLVADGTCAALNPPCALGEDTDVLLASLEVRDCQVTRICNARRDYVISGSLLRHWLPAGLLRRQLETICCPTAPAPASAGAQPGGLAFAETGFASAEPAAGAPWPLPDPGNMLRGVIQRLGAARMAPAAPPRPPATGGAAADATAQQIAALAERVTELTEQLTRTQVRLSALAGASPAGTSAASTGGPDPGAGDPGAEPGPGSGRESQPATPAQGAGDAGPPATEAGPGAAGRPATDAGPGAPGPSPAEGSRIHHRFPFTGGRDDT